MDPVIKFNKNPVEICNIYLDIDIEDRPVYEIF